MPRFQMDSLHPDDQKKIIRELIKLFTYPETEKEMGNFILSLLTKSEIGMIHRRVHIAFLLDEGFTFEEIQDRLSVGKDKISRVKKKLNSDRGQALRKAVEKFKKEYAG